MLTICDTESSQNSDHALGETWCKVKLSRKLVGESQNAHQSQKLFMCFLNFFLFSRFKIQEKKHTFPFAPFTPIFFFELLACETSTVISVVFFSRSAFCSSARMFIIKRPKSTWRRRVIGWPIIVDKCIDLWRNAQTSCLTYKAYLWYNYIMYLYIYSL